jgi:histidyl-tRNA synthetase
MSEEYLQPPRGVRDIVGEEAEIHEYLIEEFRRIARLNGFKPVIPPTLEYYKLFEAKSGVEIKKTMYVFEDKAGRLLALRPEVTASVTRIYLRKLRGEVKPLRLYYIAQCFRYEEPQYGRYREFWQAGLEIIGDQDINSDVSTAYTASYFLDTIGVKHYYVVGNVALHRIILSKAGIDPDLQDNILHYIDKQEVEKALNLLQQKTSEEYINAYRELIETDLDSLEEYAREYKDILGDRLNTFLEEAGRTIDFIDLLRELGYNVVYSPRLVRGLAYYTSIIYEYKSTDIAKERISIGGGGRYDNLTTVYGGPPEYSTGLALGLDRISLILLNKGFKPETSDEVMIIVLKEIPLKQAYMIQEQLLKNNIASWIYRTNKISKGLSIANRKNYKRVVIIAPREYSEGRVIVKYMDRGEQVTVKIKDLVDHLRSSG